ncbi:MAG: site-specific integrase [Hydrogenophaga sp.]|jgi:integrase|nr:site-specific integrase [Hydrogenophaga sp.]
MASFTNRDGRWRALVRRKGHPQYCSTFNTKAQAVAWARQIEADIDRGQAPAAEVVLGRRLLVGELIDAYRKLRATSRPIADDANEHYMLKALAKGLGTLDAARLQVSDLMGYAQARSEGGAGPYTINMDIGKLGTVMRLTSAHLKLQLRDVVAEARPLLSHMGLIGGGGKRERRPTEDELHALVAWLASERGQVYADVVLFAVATALRRGEVMRVAWADLDVDKKMLLVRDRKDPRQKVGNDQWIPLLGGAWGLVQAQPSDRGGRIFPLHEQTISKYFKQACDALGVPDLHFHDLRHEGISQLFEQGFDIPQVALVSGHKSWNNLKRYAQLKPEDMHKGPAG